VRQPQQGLSARVSDLEGGDHVAQIGAARVVPTRVELHRAQLVERVVAQQGARIIAVEAPVLRRGGVHVVQLVAVDARDLELRLREGGQGVAADQRGRVVTQGQLA